REQEALDDAKIAANEDNEEDEEPVPGVEEQDEEDLEKQTASKEVPQGNKLQESVSNENKTFSFYKFVPGYPELAEFKSKANEYEDLYDLNSFKFRRSDGTYKD